MRFLIWGLVLLFAMRVLWVCARSETGWQPLRDLAADVFRTDGGLAAASTTKLLPAEQANFWLKETARLKTAQTDPQLAMGAAWMLDTPQFHFLSRYLRPKQNQTSLVNSIGSQWELDEQSITVQTEEFESLCREHCLAFSDLAVRLAPADVRLWRSRALLQLQTQYMSLELKPRDAKWLTVLDECARHDPENALYDYLAALQLWNSAATYSWQDDGYQLTIHDTDKFQEGQRRFSTAQGQPHFRFDTDGYTAALAFLEQSSESRIQLPAAAASRNLYPKIASVMRRILRWQGVFFDEAQRQADIPHALDILQSTRHISDQIAEPTDRHQLAPMRLVVQLWSLASLHGLQRKHPHLFRETDVQQVSNQLNAERLDLKVLEQVSQRIRYHSPESLAFPKTLWLLIPFATALTTAVVTLGVACVLWACRWMLRIPSQAKSNSLGWLPHCAAWLSGFGVSFVLLGIFPVWDGTGSRFFGEELPAAAQQTLSPASWSLLQWQSRGGTLLACGLAISFIWICEVWRYQRLKSAVEPSAYAYWQRVISAGVSDVSCSCWGMCWLAILVVLAATPSVSAVFDAAYHEQQKLVIPLSQAAEQFAQYTIEIHEDAALMARLQAEVIAEHPVR